MHQDSLLETWQINNRINLYLLDAIPVNQMVTPLTKGKSVENQFAHIHNVRLMWVKASAPDLLEGLEKLEGGVSKGQLSEALSKSSEAVGALIVRACEQGGKVKNFKPHVTGFVAYLIAHEANHRAQVELALRQVGTPLPDKVAYGIWEWGSR